MACHPRRACERGSGPRQVCVASPSSPFRAPGAGMADGLRRARGDSRLPPARFGTPAAAFVAQFEGGHRPQTFSRPAGRGMAYWRGGCRNGDDGVRGPEDVAGFVPQRPFRDGDSPSGRFCPTRSGSWPQDLHGEPRADLRRYGTFDRGTRGYGRRPLTGMFVDTNVLVAARFVTAPSHVAACRCLDRTGKQRGTLAHQPPDRPRVPCCGHAAADLAGIARHRRCSERRNEADFVRSPSWRTVRTSWRC